MKSFPQMKIGKWSGEFVLIVLGVLAALALEDWRELRNDRELERHFIQGIKDDVLSDLLDLNSALAASESRVVAADDILHLLQDGAAGVVSGSVVGVDVGKIFDEIRSRHPTGSTPPGEALVLLGNLQRFDTAQITFNEATASGALGVIRDTSLRSEIANYYVNANRWGYTTDERADANASQFRRVLAENGLTLGILAPDQLVEDTFRSNSQLIAELRSFRRFAVRQQGFHTRLLSEANSLLESIDSWLGTNS